METNLKEDLFMKKIFEASKKFYFVTVAVGIICYAWAGAIALYGLMFHYSLSGFDFEVLKSEFKKRFLI